MAGPERIDPASLFGCPVFDGAGHSLGRVTAVIHRGGGCDVLVERRRWLRHAVVRLDVDDLVAGGHGAYRLAALPRVPTSRDGWVA